MNFLLPILFAILISCEDEVINETFTKAVGNFVNNEYINSHQISLEHFTYSSSESNTNYPISNAFRVDDYWVSNDTVNSTQKPYILIRFNEAYSLEGFVLRHGYRTRGSNRYYDGAPLQLNVYSSLYDEPLRLKYFFSGTYYQSSDDNWESVQFVFSKPIECDTLKLEYLDVTLAESFVNDYCASARHIILFEYINESKNIPISDVTGDYADANYIAKHKLPLSAFSYYATDSKDGYPITNLFDGIITKNYWVSKYPNEWIFKSQFL